jgi:integrase
LETATETKTIAGEKGKLIEYAWKLKKRGLQENTIALRSYLLNQLVKLGANLNSTDSVESVLATEKFTKSKKHQLVSAYRSFTKIFKIPWEPIKTSYQPKQPHIPLETELDQLIAASGKRTAAFLQTLKDTGARCGEIAKLEWTDINEANLTVRINNAEKGSLSRTVRVTEKTIAMIKKKLTKKYTPLIFNPNTCIYKTTITATRKRLARTLQNPRFNLIHLHSLRHWKATTEYAKTRDILHVMKLLGHKDIRNTIIYTQLSEFRSEEYYSAVAKNIEEARELIESGFSFVCDIKGAMLFSKRK